MFAFNPPEFLVQIVAGVGPVFVVSLLGPWSHSAHCCYWFPTLTDWGC